MLTWWLDVWERWGPVLGAVAVALPAAALEEQRTPSTQPVVIQRRGLAMMRRPSAGGRH